MMGISGPGTGSHVFPFELNISDSFNETPQASPILGQLETLSLSRQSGTLKRAFHSPTVLGPDQMRKLGLVFRSCDSDPISSAE